MVAHRSNGLRSGSHCHLLLTDVDEHPPPPFRGRGPRAFANDGGESGPRPVA